MADKIANNISSPLSDEIQKNPIGGENETKLCSLLENEMHQFECNSFEELSHSQIFFMRYPVTWWTLRLFSVGFILAIFIIIPILFFAGDKISMTDRSNLSGIMLVLLFLVGVYFVSIHGKPGTIKQEYSQFDNGQ